MYAFQRQNAKGLGGQEGSGEKKGCFGGWFYSVKWESFKDKYPGIPVSVLELSDFHFLDLIRALCRLRLTFTIDCLGQIRQKVGLMFLESCALCSDWLESALFRL